MLMLDGLGWEGCCDFVLCVCGKRIKKEEVD